VNFEVTIGWTMSDRDAGCSSFSDGYRPGAKQHTETITIEWTNPPMLFGGTVDLNRAAEVLAEACYYATNAPRFTCPDGLTGQVCRAIDATCYHGHQAGHYSLSVGDTVTVGEITLACASLGWERV